MARATKTARTGTTKRSGGRKNAGSSRKSPRNLRSRRTRAATATVPRTGPKTATGTDFDYPWSERLSKIPREPAVKITVPYVVPDFAEYVLEVRRI